MKMITTKDPKVALLNICKKNCVMQHSLASLMQQVVDMKKRCGDDDLFGSARTPESLDRIMEELVYIFSCEANCDIMAAREVFDGREVEIPVFFDENGNPLEETR